MAFKLHMVADANHGLPLAHFVTKGNRNESQELPPLVAHAKSQLDWLAPRVAIADRGYDSAANHQALWFDHGILPIIHMRRPPKTAHSDLYRGIYTTEGVPICEGMMTMQYMGTDRQKTARLPMPQGRVRDEGLPIGRSAALHDGIPPRPQRGHTLVRRDTEGQQAVASALPETAGGGAVVQRDEGVAKVGTALPAGPAPSEAPRPYVHADLSGDGAHAPTGGAEARYALDGAGRCLTQWGHFRVALTTTTVLVSLCQLP